MEEDDNDGGGPSRAHMETIVKYVTMVTDISLKFDIILNRMKRFIGKESYDKLCDMEEKTGMKEMIKVLQEKEPENCLQILVDVLVECGCLKNTGWKEKPDPISALLLELRESISVIERLMESVEEGDVDEVEQLLSQYPIPQDMEHITRECCVLSLERTDLPLVKFLYQEYRSMLDNECTLERFLTEAVRVDFTEGVQFLFSQGLPPEEKLFYMELLEKTKSVDMLTLLVIEGKIGKSLIYKPWYVSSIFYHQILNSSTQADCMSRVQILVDAGARVENLIANRERALLKIIKERWFKVFVYVVNQLKDINFTNRYQQNILHVILFTDKDGDVRNIILDFVRNLVERGIDINSVDKHGQSPLMLSCRAGYYDVVKYLSERGAYVNKVDKYGLTAVMWACQEDHKDIVKYLITHCGADVNKVNNEGQTTLMLACKGGYKDIVEYMIQHCGADVNMVDKDGQTALMWACREGNKDIVEYLIQHGGANVNKVDNKGQAALMKACREGHKDIVEYLIQDCGADVNMVEYDGKDKLAKSSALTIACEKCRKDIVECLIHGGADVNMGVRGGVTPLMWACERGYKDIVECLIHGGADVDKVDYNGRTAIMMACKGCHKDVVKYLIKHGGADVNKVDNEGHSAFYHCLTNDFIKEEEQYAMFKFLVESGADLSLLSIGVQLFELILNRKLYKLFLYVISLKPEIVDVTDKGENILHLLAKVNYEFKVGQFHWLFDGHVDINHKNRHTDTPLMVAAVLLNEKYLEVFTHHPAVDLNKQNNNGHTALHCLILGFTELIQGIRQRHNEGIAQNYCQQFYPMYMRCVDSLLDAGTDVNVQDNEGRTVLMMAVRENDKQLVRKLLDAGAMVDKVDRSGRHALHYVDFSDSVYDLTIFFLIFPSGENHLLDLPCIHGNTLIQTVLQFPLWWEPCKVVAFVRWLVSRNCSLRHLRGRTGHSAYNDLSLDDFSCSQRQNLRELLYRSGAPKDEIFSTINFQAEDEDENAIFYSRNREMFEQFCLNVSLRSMCIRVFRQRLGTEIRARLPGLEIPTIVKKSLLLEDVVGDGDDGVLGGFDELEDESDYCSYIVDKDREYFYYLEDGTSSIHRYYSYYKLYDDEDDDDEDDDDDGDCYDY